MPHFPKRLLRRCQICIDPGLTEGEFDFTFNRIRPFAGGDRTSASQSPYAELVLDEIRIGQTYADVAPIVPRLSVTRNGDSVILGWSGNYQLQAADEVTGAYFTLLGATSPHTNEVSGMQQFFRLSD